MPLYRRPRFAYGQRSRSRRYAQDNNGMRYGSRCNSGFGSDPRVYGNPRCKPFPWERDRDFFNLRHHKMLAREIQRQKEEEKAEEYASKLEEKRLKKKMAAARERARQRAEKEKKEEAERLKIEKELEAEEERERIRLQKEKEMRERRRREEKERLEKEMKALEEKAKREEEEKLRKQKEEEELRKKRETEMREIQVVSIDLHLKENAKNHHTEKYEMVEREKDPEPVIRRGQKVLMTIIFNKEYYKDKHDLLLVFKIGQSASSLRGTAGAVAVNEGGKKELNPKEWQANLLSKDGSKQVDVEFNFPCDCIVGEWHMYVETKIHNPDGSLDDFDKYQYEKDINVLFNPWCKEDQVYFEDEELLEEYVLNDNTVLFQGNSRWPRALDWTLDQFDDGILEICFQILRTGFGYEYMQSMGNPVIVSRIISGVMNSCDGDGVLTGKWSGDYSDGTKPWEWKGSGDILKTYRETRDSVRYGQCWVFSGITLTVCRALGIPSKSVTCFDSGHDTDKTTTMDKFVSRDGEILKDSDSIWNFHVWNEVWMARPEISVNNDFNGWQVIDGTPQEKSQGKFVCGPAPVSAIKKGFTIYPYDIAFVFAEVNSDQCTWEVSDDGKTTKLIGYDEDVVGTKILSKAPGIDNYGWQCRRAQVTKDYKFPENTVENRVAVRRAKEYSKTYRSYIGEMAVPDIRLKVQNIDEIFIGQDFKIRFNAKNFAEEGPRRLKDIKVNLYATSYTGNSRMRVKHETMSDIILKKGEEVTREIDVSAADYTSKIYFDASMEIIVLAKSVNDKDPDDEGISVMSSDKFTLNNPDIEFEAPKKVKRGEKFMIQFKFQTTITGDQQNRKWPIHCPSFLKIGDVDDSSSDPNAGIWRGKVELTAMRTGLRPITVGFKSDIFYDFSSTIQVTVE